MQSHKKLSIHLNQFYFYHKIEGAKIEDIEDITSNYISRMENKIFQQPDVALRAIKVEINDIYIHYNRYEEELRLYLKEMDDIIYRCINSLFVPIQ